MVSWVCNQCSCTGRTLRMGALTWSLMLCGHHPEILNTFIFESVFHNCSLMEQWRMLWGFGDAVHMWFCLYMPNLSGMVSCLPAPLPLPSNHCQPMPKKSFPHRHGEGHSKRMDIYSPRCKMGHWTPLTILALPVLLCSRNEALNSKYDIWNLMERENAEEDKEVFSCFWTGPLLFSHCIEPCTFYSLHCNAQ